MLIVTVLTGVALVGIAWVAGEVTKLQPTPQPAKAPARKPGRR
jgi:hypothetical protein